MFVSAKRDGGFQFPLSLDAVAFALNLSDGKVLRIAVIGGHLGSACALAAGTEV